MKALNASAETFREHAWTPLAAVLLSHGRYSFDSRVGQALNRLDRAFAVPPSVTQYAANRARNTLHKVFYVALAAALTEAHQSSPAQQQRVLTTAIKAALGVAFVAMPALVAATIGLPAGHCPKCGEPNKYATKCHRASWQKSPGIREPAAS
jgi:hypothetical protein